MADEKADNLKTGKLLGHYRILKKIGAGGMGEVYLAEDTKLSRKVALKILPEEFAADARRLKRFEREAQAVSALNHPNILTVHEFARAGDAHFLATEFVEGKTLREKIGGGELSLVDALKIAEQSAFALCAAHEAGIVHRDIKPENIMIRRDGIVKVLDFGIAKLIAPSGDVVDTEGETLEKKWTATQPGAFIGTLAYMSPEQVRGKTLDARSDIFSLGIVLYEMLTGKDPFERGTSGDIIAAILTENPPPVTDEKNDAPAELERILNKALKKNADERYQTSKDFLLDVKSLRREIEFAGVSAARTGGAAGENKMRLTGAANAQTTSAATAATTQAQSKFSPAHWLLIFLAIVLAGGGAWWFIAERSFEGEAIQPAAFSQIEVVNWRSMPGEIYSTGAFSPDAKMVAFSSNKSGAKNIWVKQLAGGEAVQITKDEFGNQNPIWSPDGGEIAFFSTRGGAFSLWRMPSFGGNPTFIKAIEDGGAILRRWSKSDRIYYQSKQNLFALDIKTGQTNQLTNFDSGAVSANSLSVSADEKQIACVAFENGRYGILTMPPGGAPERIYDSADEIRNAVWHPDGKRVIYSQKIGGAFQIFAVAAGGKPVQITFGERDALALDASVDGSKILYGASKEESDVWGVNLERGEEFSFASDINSELWATVAPDNKTVAFQSIKNLSQGDKVCCGAILTKRVEQPGAETFQLVAEGALPQFSPDGKRLAFMRLAGETFNLWTIGAAGGAEKQLTNGGELPFAEYSVLPYNRTQASIYDWSPDGGKIAYIAGENNQSNVWLVDVGDASRTRLTENTDANLFFYCPLWSAGGKSIAFASKTNKAAADGKRYFGAAIVDVETKSVKAVAQTENFGRLLGFSASGKELLLAEIKGKTPTGLPVETTIIEVSIETGERRQIAKLDAAYFYNIHLSADKKMLAYVSNRDGKDNIWLIRTAAGGEARKITLNNDTRLYFSSLAWSPDNRAIYFGRQTRYSLLSMVTNFK